MSNPSEMRGATPADAPSSAHSKKTIGELVAEVSQKFSALVRDEIKLAQVQLTEKVSKLGVGGAMLAVAGVIVAIYAVPVLLYAAIQGLAVALPLWLSALIIGLVLVIAAGIIGFLGYKKLQKAKDVTSPDPVTVLKEDVNAVKKGLKK